MIRCTGFVREIRGNSRMGLWRWGIVFLLLVSVCAGLTGCDHIYRLLQKEGAEEKDILGEVVPLERNEQVLKVQRLLKLYGYRVGTPDGIFGNNTRNAIEDFQRDNGLKMSRFVDQATWDKLIFFEQCGLVVEGKLNVTAVQKALKAAGMSIGIVDGRMGNRTQTAIRDFQKSSGLKPDGKVGYKTLKEMAVYICAHPGQEEAEAPAEEVEKNGKGSARR